MTWFDVEIRWDGDNEYRYAIEAESADEAKTIALARAPEPDANVVPLYLDPEDANVDYDDIIRHGE